MVAPDVLLVGGLVVYVAAARAALSLPSGAARDWAFAAVNVAAVFTICYSTLKHPLFLPVYVALVVGHWVLLRWLARREGALPWVAFGYPIVLLVAVKYLAFAWGPVWRALDTPESARFAGLYFVGLSYMAFRLSHLVLEVRNGVVEPPGLGPYLGFAFFFPTMQVGPINRYSVHARSLDAPDPAVTPPLRCLSRIAVGLTKYLFLSTLADQVGYAGLLGDQRPRTPVDVFIAAVAYYAYLYWNFSGFCDVAIGTAGLLGVKVDENFDAPFEARNISDYWNRWHITLSTYIRDVLFMPLSKALVGRMGPKRRDHAVAIATFITFVIVGVWHGAGLNFVVFGCIHAAGVVAHHYYAAWLRRRLGKEGVARYNESRLIRGACILATQAYVTMGLAVFAARGDGLARAVARLLHRS